jgi:hypothetical protein
MDVPLRAPPALLDLPPDAPAGGPGPPVPVLLVDDVPANLLALEAALADPGLALVKAASGAEALRHLLRGDYAAVLLDVRCPSWTGSRRPGWSAAGSAPGTRRSCS